MGKLLRINLNTRKFQFEKLSADQEMLGGRGLSSAIIAEEVPPTTDPLGADSKLIFAAGLLAGTPIANTGRLSVGAKSPMTRAIKEANVGGTVAHKLAGLGVRAVVFEGCASELLMVKISTEGVAFQSAKAFKRTGLYDFFIDMKNQFGEHVGVAAIGPAGEDKLIAAGVAVTSPDFRIRMAARGGMGAVMGAKNLKAVVVDDTNGPGIDILDPVKLKTAARHFSKGLVAHPLVQGLKALGTPLLVGLTNDALGCLATKNYRMGSFGGAGKISGEYIARLMDSRPNAEPMHSCMKGCAIRCSNVFTDAGGSELVSGLEFETIALMGSNCLIDDIDCIAEMNRICNDVGVDTMDVGGAIGLLMEAGVLAWGDGPAALEIIRGIGQRTDRGSMIGNGTGFTGKKLGSKRIPVVKGQCLAGYDPRILKGTGVTYATSTMGADHTCGNALPSPDNPAYDPSSSTGQGAMSQFLQTFFAAVDTLGLCLFASLPMLDVPELQQFLMSGIDAIQKESPGENYMLDLGEKVLGIEKQFNTAAGLSAADDRLPGFFLEESLPPGGNRFDVPDEELDSVLGVL
ncbi:MAG: aldehyde ferredoxin oxidoreductase [Desulfobacteraceae bacterium]|nr:aldehyde ferredoxin oxidoreductase [Desulfobacteraceae bacterium]